VLALDTTKSNFGPSPEKETKKTQNFIYLLLLGKLGPYLTHFASKAPYCTKYPPTVNTTTRRKKKHPKASNVISKMVLQHWAHM
jgi:hypothetical protein